MEDREIMELAARLEASLAADEGIVHCDFSVEQADKPQSWNDKYYLVGNRVGYLRLAVLFLRAASQAPKDTQTAIIDVPLPHRDISIFDFKWLERREDVEREENELEPYVGTWRDMVVSGIISVVLALLCLFLVVGFVSVVRWVYSLLGV